MPIISGFPAGGNAKFPEGGKTDQVLVKTEEGEAWGNVKTVAEKATQKPISFQVTGLEGEEFTIEFTEDGEGGSSGVESFNGRSGAVVPQAGDYTAEMVGAIPITRTVNGKPLSADITLVAADVGARSNTWTPTAAETGSIPATEKGIPSGVATLDESGKIPSTQLPDMNYDPSGSASTVQGNLDTHIANKANPHAVTAEQIGAVPSSRTVNGKPLSSNISLSAADVGARSNTWTPTAANVGALPITGGTLTGNLRIKNSSNSGMKLNFGDNEYVYLHESSDDNLDIKAKTINFLCTNLRQNGSDIGSGGVVAGTYAGSCSDGQTQTINLGFRPKCVMIMRDYTYIYDEDHAPWYFYQFEDYDDVKYGDLRRDEQGQDCQFVVLFDGISYEATNGDRDNNTNKSMVVAEITSTGFLIGSASYSRMDTTSTRDYYHKANFSMANSGRTYYYLAFK